MLQKNTAVEKADDVYSQDAHDEKCVHGSENILPFQFHSGWQH